MTLCTTTTSSVTNFRNYPKAVLIIIIITQRYAFDVHVKQDGMLQTIEIVQILFILSTRLVESAKVIDH